MDCGIHLRRAPAWLKKCGRALQGFRSLTVAAPIRAARVSKRLSIREHLGSPGLSRWPNAASHPNPYFTVLTVLAMLMAEASNAGSS